MKCKPKEVEASAIHHLTADEMNEAGEDEGVMVIVMMILRIKLGNQLQISASR